MKKTYLYSATIIVMILVNATCAVAARISDHNHPFKKGNSLKRSYSALRSRKVNNVLFAFNKIAVPAKCYRELDHVAKLMVDSNASLKLGGYADNKGGYVYNWKLSQKRAEAVKSYLVSRGADSSKIAATEFGYTHPAATNKTAAGRQKNRRVEIHFTN